MNDVAAEIRDRIEALPALPALSRRVMGHLSDPDVDLYFLADELQHDPGMTINLLRLANSAVYGGSQRVDSVRMAISRLGLKSLVQLVVASGVSDVLTTRLAGYQLQPEELLTHSVYVAVATEDLARLLGVSGSSVPFTAGLLHDVGKIVLDDFVGHQAGRLLAEAEATQQPFDRVERAVLGVSHADVGAQILRLWEFPDELVAAVLGHHRPVPTAARMMLVNIVHAADSLAYAEGIGAGIDAPYYPPARSAVAGLGLSAAALQQVAAHAWTKVHAIVTSLHGTQPAASHKRSEQAWTTLTA